MVLTLQHPPFEYSPVQLGPAQCCHLTDYLRTKHSTRAPHSTSRCHFAVCKALNAGVGILSRTSPTRFIIAHRASADPCSFLASAEHFQPATPPLSTRLTDTSHLSYTHANAAHHRTTRNHTTPILLRAPQPPRALTTNLPDHRHTSTR